MQDPTEARQDPIEAREERDFHEPDGRGREGEVVKPAAKARQGLSSSRVLTVLLASIALLVVAYIASYLANAIGGV